MSNSSVSTSSVWDIVNTDLAAARSRGDVADDLRRLSGLLLAVVTQPGH